MGFYVGNSGNANVNATSSGFKAPVFTSSTLPASPVEGQVIYNSTTQYMQVYANGGWNNLGVFPGTAGYPYRQIIVKSFVMGGYQNSSPWRNVNKMVHSTDVCTNLGDLLSYAGVYTSGVNNLTKGFLWSTDGSFPGSSTTTSAINMSTETTAGTNANWNTRVARDDMGTGFKETEFAYIVGGDKHVFGIFGGLALWYIFLTQTWNIKKLLSYINWDVLLSVAIVIVLGNYLKSHSAYFTELIKTAGVDPSTFLGMTIISFLGFMASFLMGSSGKFVALAVLMSSVFGPQYFLWFFAIDFAGYLLSPTHKCVMVGNKYFGTPIKQYFTILGLWAGLLLLTAGLTTFLGA